MKNSGIYELAIGKVKPGTSREAYLQAAVAVEVDLHRMPGFRSRRLLAGADGLWVDLVEWDSLEEALQAAEAFTNEPSAQPMIAMLDADTIRMYHLETMYVDVHAAGSVTHSKAE